MAGSYLHIIYTTPTETHSLIDGDKEVPIPEEKQVGDIRTPEDMIGMIENLGDAYEAIEELYGMVWVMALGLTDLAAVRVTPKEIVEHARKNYQLGLDVAVDRDLGFET